MNESLINHLFLPQYLPSSADDDYLIGKDHQYEYKLLEYINEYFCSIRTTDIAINLPIFPVLIDCISRWSHLQSLQNISVTDIQSTIEQLPSNHFLPLYFHAQNAAILIEIDENNVNQPQISAWQVLLSTEMITSSLMPHFSCFPVTTYSLHDRSELTSRVHCELLRDFMLNTIEYSKVYKCSNELDEIREVPQSHYVCRWWIEQFKNIQIENCFHKSIQFKKKHRDQIRWNQTNLPFRRSGLWMTIKVVLHTVLVKRLQYFGTVVYKLLITHFLTYVIQKISMHTELLVHCIRKIVRRLNKIESHTISNDAKDLNLWIDHTMQEIESTIKRLIPESNWQKTIQNTSKLNQSSLTKDLKLSSSKTHHHACRKLKAYLRNDCNSNNTPIPTQKIKIYEDLTPDNHNDYIPSFDVLTNRLGCTISNALTYMEIWVQLCLEQWINSCSPTINRKNRFEILFHFYEKYQSVALTHYYSKNGPSDSLGYSQFILTSLTIIQLMHKKLCRDQRFNRLQLHTIDIPNLMKLFEYLTLPNRDDMIRAYNLYDYYDEFRDKEYPDLLNDIKSKHAFGVSYAAQSSSMNNDLERIRIEAERDKEDKIAEVVNAKQKYFQLMKEMDNHTCEPFEIHNPNECHRCKLSREANKIKVKVFECPIPIEQESALAVMFELQMPVEIRCYRDILWQFINRGQTEPMKKTYEWLTIPTHASKLKPFYTNSIDCKVKLISSTKSISQSHYSRPPSIVLTSVEKFLFENTVKVEITPTNPIDFDDEHRILTPQLEHSDYKQLQFAIMNTEFLQNNVITQISDCPSRLKSIQFIEFGSFRSGHRLQWWNLLMLFEMDSLSIAEESVAILLTHSLLQYGPVISDKNTFPNSWCPESHRDLLEDHFVDELITRLDRRLYECESNWQNELVLVVITIITMRILTICNSFKEDKVAQLARKCRRIGERWIDLIRKTTESMSSTIFNQIEKFRIKMIHISVACILTLSTHEDRIKCLLSSDDDVISLLKTAAIVHDNICLKTTQSNMNDEPYVYMLSDNAHHTKRITNIHLSRLGIAFQYNGNTQITTSREYSDMCIDEDQWLGTLTGLTSGLLLSPLSNNNSELNHYLYRKIIVPFGNPHSKRMQNDIHQTVTIQRTSLSSKESSHYFVFILNDRLRMLQSTDSPTGWLYLALLHAMTSHSLPDQYTGMTGIERAFQLLNSAGCWSDQPYNFLSRNILAQIALISPKVDYYPKHFTCMQKIDWNDNGLPFSLQHFGYYLIAKQLIKTSEQLHFIYSSDLPTKLSESFEEELYNENLLKKLYWDYRDSYNPMVRLSAEMETDMLRTYPTKTYYLISEDVSHITNYPTSRLVDDLYRKGNVTLKDCSNLHWLPLSQWLTEENGLKNVWIGLLKLVCYSKAQATENDTNNVQRLHRLLDFLHYISSKYQINPFYLQMLQTVLNTPTITFSCIEFPRFTEYQNIEETYVIQKRFPFEKRPSADIRNRVKAEVEECLKKNSRYTGSKTSLINTDEIYWINVLLDSWQLNRSLQHFLQSVQNMICSVPIQCFHSKAAYNAQQFTVELFEHHHQIQLKSSDESLNNELLLKATKKFHHLHTSHFSTQNKSLSIIEQQRNFPNEIFPFINNEENPLQKIDNYFKNQLAESWNTFLSNEQYEEEQPSVHEIEELLNSIQTESTTFWNELITSLKSSNELLTDQSSSFNLSTNQCTLLGGTLVNWTLEQQIERALHYIYHNKLEDFKKEISNIPHSNWIPSEHISWLILELEMNIIIRNIQIKVAHHMMQKDNSIGKNLVMQMNMGEGKTSVILPMLAVNLSSTDSTLVRIIVLKSLLPTNYLSLRHKLGGLLNRRILPFACRRDRNLTDEQVKQISIRLQQGLQHNDVILTSPEDLLSFDLLTIDKCRRNEFEIARSMLTVQRWMKTYVHDVLDESDEILHVKYQLIYTVGDQQQVDGGAERWITIQSILESVKNYAADISDRFPEETSFKRSEQKSAFPQYRLQSNQSYPLLCEMIANDWLSKRNYRQNDKDNILSFILHPNLSGDHLITQFPAHEIQLFLIVRGLLSSEVLLIALKKRHRVNYGINPNPSFHRFMAVPFRAKDVAADRTEFGHPDVALVLTQLSYYYSGLTDSQLKQCFDRLSKRESDPATIYEQWIRYEDKDRIPSSIIHWNGVNLEDYHQRTEHIFPTFRYHMLVVNYFLNHFVFPREAKQFPYKIISSAWDLSSSIRSKPITGFSGTNDTQLLLPIHIRQHELSELQKTDAIVVNNLLQNGNESYHVLPMNAISNDILQQICDYKERIHVILDVGALFVDKTNRDIAVHWLNLSDKHQIDYAVYFDFDSIVVCDRQYHHQRFETSPASERLDHCIFYLDEIHTRGTDFKFPKRFRAAVTLGNGLTKDRFVQACMRMRQLGHGHSLTFWSSNEVHQQMTALKRQLSSNQQSYVIDILRWVYQNTIHSTWEGLYYWAEQSLSFQRKLSASQKIQWENDQQNLSNTIMKEFAEQCLEPEITELKSMYGTSKDLYTLRNIYLTRYQQSKYHLSLEIHTAVLQRLQEYGGSKQRLSQLLDEEQQRELEQELEEERQLARPLSVKPADPILHKEIKMLCNQRIDELNLDQLREVFQPISYAFNDTKFYHECQPETWQKTLWVTTEFQRVISTTGEILDPFLRPPRWIIVYRNKHIIFVSPFEANWLIGQLRFNNVSTTTLRLLLPRIKREQGIFVDTPTLMIPRSVERSDESNVYCIPIAWLAQLFVFNGTLYFKSTNEQIAYCQYLSLCPRPRTVEEEEAFQQGWIAVDGFVKDPIHRRLLKLQDARFISNPLMFIKQLIENRNNSYIPVASHVGSIIFNSQKLL
ncbi:hypothetical protein I4U23_015333 [Adineta vaga]|nr:hypothetical protein I4U23_015333 [Adineta vaga]